MPHFAAVLLLALALAACDSAEEPASPTLRFEARIDGAAWEADTAAASADDLAMVLWGRKNRVTDGFFCRPDPCEELAFDVRPPATGPRSYPLTGLSRATFTVADGDQVIRSYTSVDGRGELVVESAEAGVLAGTFRLDLVNEADAADTLRVTDGRFRVPFAAGG